MDNRNHQDMKDAHKDLLAIDQLSEGLDWFTTVTEHTGVANRIKATDTMNLRRIVNGDVCETLENQSVAEDFAQKELVFRASSESPIKENVNGYTKFNHSIHEVLSPDDPVETWIADFVKSENPKFDGKSKKERINMALGAYYAATKKNESLQEKRDFRIVSLITKEADTGVIKFFLESLIDLQSKTVLEINDSFDEFKFELYESSFSPGSESSVKCVKPWGACKVGNVYKGIWKPAARPNQLTLDLNHSLPGATAHPTIFYNKSNKQLDLPKQFELL